MTETIASSPQEPARRRVPVKPLALLLGVVAITVALTIFHDQAALWIKQLQGWIKVRGSWGPLAFIIVYIVFTVLALPGTLLTVLAGTLFESPVQAVILVSIASTAGATLCFVIARYVARDSVARWARKSNKFRRLDEMTEKNGAIIVAITRLVPIFPFNLQNYGYGLTRVRLPTYILFSWLCMLPGTVVFVLAPAGLVQGLKEGKVPWPLLAILLGAIVLALAMTYLGKRYLAGKEAAHRQPRPSGQPRRKETQAMADYDLLVIGGGAGGLNVASAAAQLGATVALVEKRKLGGDCLWHGCVPSKALIRCAAAAHSLREIDRFGLRVEGLQTDFPRAMKYVRDVQAGIAEHDDPERFRKMGVDVFFGDGHFADDRTFELEGRRLVGRKIVIATGSRPLELAIPGLDEVGCRTNLTIFDLPTLPPRLLVLGGGPIGVEMGQSFARLGSSVTIIETNDHLLPHDDPECTDLLASAMAGEGIRVLTGRKALRAEKGDHGAKRLVVADKYGQETAFEGDEILLAIGRAPNSRSLGLTAAGVETNQRGFITVDNRLRTSRKHIFALGDAKGFPMFTHMAEYEAGVVVPNALYGLPRKARYTVVPWCTYSDPEVARVGLTEQQAREADLDVAVYRVGFDAADRPVIDGQSAGLVKLVCRKKKLLGATVVGHRAGDILQQYVLAMANGLPLTGVSATIEVYPGYGELARRAANLYYKETFFEGRLPRIMHRLRRLHGRVGPQR